MQEQNPENIFNRPNVAEAAGDNSKHIFVLQSSGKKTKTRKNL